MLAPWKKSYDKLDSVLKSRDITLPTKVFIVKAVVFPIVIYECEKERKWNYSVMSDSLRPSSIHGIFRARVLEWVAISFSNGCENWTIKKAEHRRIDAFKLWCWRRLLRVLWTVRRSNQSILNEISPEYSLEGLMLKLKLQSFATWCKELTHWERPWCWERLKAGREGDVRGWDG